MVGPQPARKSASTLGTVISGRSRQYTVETKRLLRPGQAERQQEEERQVARLEDLRPVAICMSGHKSLPLAILIQQKTTKTPCRSAWSAKSTNLRAYFEISGK